MGALSREVSPGSAFEVVGRVWHVGMIRARLEGKAAEEAEKVDWARLVEGAAIVRTGFDIFGPFAIMGISGAEGVEGWVWALAAPSTRLHFRLVRGARRVVKEGLRRFSVLYGVTDLAYPKTVRFMRLLGFEFLPEVQMGSKRCLPMRLRRVD